MTDSVSTKVGLRIKERIERLLDNPIQGSKKARAVRQEVKTVAKASKKKGSMKGLIAARKALVAKYGTSNIGKINKMKKAGKLPAAAPAAKKPRKKAKAKKATHKRATAAAKPRKKPRKKAKAKAASKPRKTRSKAKATRKPRKKTRRVSHTVGGKVHVVKMPGATRIKYIRIEEAKKRRRRRKPKGTGLVMTPAGFVSRKLMENPGFESNPMGTYSALFENPMGPYSKQSMVAFGWAAGGVGLGFAFAELVDRYVATRKPGDIGERKAGHAWYGRNAVAAIQRRPDAMRLGVQAVGALGAIGGAYFLRGRRYLPWLLGGTAIGFGGNLFRHLLNWWVFPMAFKVDKDKPGALNLGNRLFALEQSALQDELDKLWEKWVDVQALADGQTASDVDPPVLSPLANDGGKNLLTLGGARSNGPLHGAVGFVSEPGRVGACMSCGGMEGHWTNCPGLCPDCPDGSGIQQEEPFYAPSSDLPINPELFQQPSDDGSGGQQTERPFTPQPERPFTPQPERPYNPQPTDSRGHQPLIPSTAFRPTPQRSAGVTPRQPRPVVQPIIAGVAGVEERQTALRSVGGEVGEE